MFSQFSSISLPVPRFLNWSSAGAIDITSVDIHDVESQQGKRARALKHLLKLNHASNSILYHNLTYHNHLPHILGSAYILGAEADHLEEVYEKESKELEKWTDSPNEVSKHDWRDYLGDQRYQRAYVDFFEDELVLDGYDWRKVLDEFLFQGKEPLINGLIGGLGHPLIHLGYAYELSSREVAMEALGLACVSYNYFHKYLDDDTYSRPSTYSTTSLTDVLRKVASDTRFDGMFQHPGSDNLELLFKEHEKLVLEHWNAWDISNPKKQFEESQSAAVALLMASVQPESSSYDFFMVHILTTSHAVRILLPLIPAKFHVTLVRQWWLLSLAVYISQLRPPIEKEAVLVTEINGKDWNWVDTQAIEGEWAIDAHFVKALRAMKEASHTWGDNDGFYLKSAIKFVAEFSGWGGYGLQEENGAS